MVNKVLISLLVFILALASLAGCNPTEPNIDKNQTQTSTATTQPTISPTTIPNATQTLPVTTQQTTPPSTPSAEEPGGEAINLAMSNKTRITNPETDIQDILELSDGNLAFASNLYAALSRIDGNIFLSPYSIYQALAMTYAGAEGETETQMASTLHYTLPQNLLHPAFNSLDLQLALRGEGAKGKDGEGFRLNIVNATWGQQGYTFLDDFLDILAQYYGAGIRLLDFAHFPEASRTIMNDWVSQQTEGRIEDLLPEGSISEVTRLVLTNAIYFNAAWQYPFDEKQTLEDSFYLLDGSQVEIPMMNQVNFLGYTEGDGYQTVELPYSGGELSMVVLVPEQDGFSNFEASLNSQKLADILSDISYMDVTLSMPKFEFDSAFSLKKALSDMGMPIAFSNDANFSGMNGNHDLYIGDVLHKAFVSVDEAGTEAAAATDVVMILKGLPEEPKEVNLNRPFIFLVRDIETNTILFMGRLLNPNHSN